MVPLPVPEGVTVHHAALLCAVHAAFEVTEKAVLPEVAPTCWLAGETDSVAAVPA